MQQNAFLLFTNKIDHWGNIVLKGVEFGEKCTDHVKTVIRNKDKNEELYK